MAENSHPEMICRSSYGNTGCTEVLIGRGDRPALCFEINE